MISCFFKFLLDPVSGQDEFEDRGPEDGLRGGKKAGVWDGVEGYDALLVVQPGFKASFGFVLHAGSWPPFEELLIQPANVVSGSLGIINVVVNNTTFMIKMQRFFKV